MNRTPLLNNLINANRPPIQRKLTDCSLLFHSSKLVLTSTTPTRGACPPLGRGTPACPAPPRGAGWQKGGKSLPAHLLNLGDGFYGMVDDFGFGVEP